MVSKTSEGVGPGRFPATLRDARVKASGAASAHTWLQLTWRVPCAGTLL